MKCVLCDSDQSRVIDSRETNNGTSIRRRRECLKCHERFTTYEYVMNYPIVVIKKMVHVKNIIEKNYIIHFGLHVKSDRYRKKLSLRL